ncbi:glycyl-radical enzyme activating protein [Parabacteroides sp. AM08-6]|uniref:glycyl-radical enzyme activating protein n=1 Tax=Parabacteroides sp. AM08-6 TaxID=2292053 RepID=UPI000F00D50B|nr:glycyl-radical enzyme activating protein [Parabacteroides sp. AM08-6]RHJ87798.1 glycyl-radical enzyme activating protein [Parabacteroides sp. AM08-6]
MLIFDIKRYAINDGPGIRTTIFMKGCPLSCIWCHNPEGVSGQKEKLYTKKKCIGCSACVEACPQKALTLTADGIVTDKNRCIVCGNCAEVCPALAIEISGTEYSTDRLMKEIEKETLFMDRSEGGVTFCGGEPLLHPDELLELLRRCGELGIHRAVDTTLFARPETVRKVMENCELLLVDLKQMDTKKHRLFCGVPNEQILSNLRMIAEAGHDFHIRIPLIEGVNADVENMTQSAAFLASLPWKRRCVNLLPYHDIGKGKHEKRGSVYNPNRYPLSAPSEETVERCRSIFAGYGIETIIGG